MNCEIYKTSCKVEVGPKFLLVPSQPHTHSRHLQVPLFWLRMSATCAIRVNDLKIELESFES